MAVTPPAKGAPVECPAGRRPLRARRLPPVRRGARRDRGSPRRAAAVSAAGGRHRVRSRHPRGLSGAHPGGRGRGPGRVGARARARCARASPRRRIGGWALSTLSAVSPQRANEASVPAVTTDEAQGPLLAEGERLSLGVAARLSRYLQVLIQARKMDKETIPSQELSAYTHINSTQIRRDLSGFGKFGKRGVGYGVEFLVAEIRKILRTSGQHNIVLFGAGNLGQAIASSDIFADHGFRIVAIFDVDPKLIGREFGGVRVRDLSELPAIVEEEDVVVGVLAVPSDAAQGVADRLV